MRTSELIALSRKYNLTIQVNPEDPYITISRGFQFGRNRMRIKRYISWADFEILEDCLAYLKEEIDSEEVTLINEHSRI